MTTTYELAFYTVYKRIYPLALNNSLPTITPKNYKNILADKNIKDEWIDNLLKIKFISLFSLFSGFDRHFITHIVFTVDKLQDEKCNEIIKIVNLKRRYRACYIQDIKKTFFCIATRNWYRSEEKSKMLFKWWAELPNLILEVFK